MTDRHGCHNRKPFKETAFVQVGWRLEMALPLPQVWERTAVLAEIPVPMSKDCQHTLSAPNDPKCQGCRWQKVQP